MCGSAVNMYWRVWRGCVCARARASVSILRSVVNYGQNISVTQAVMYTPVSVEMAQDQQQAREGINVRVSGASGNRWG